MSVHIIPAVSVVFFLLVHIGHSQDEKLLCQDEQLRNHVIREILRETRTSLRSEEPYTLVDVPGFLQLSDGLLWGVSSLYLRSEPQATCSSSYATLHLLMSINKLHVRYKWGIRIIPGLKGYFTATSKRITAEVQLEAPLKKNTTATVDRVRITELSGVDVKVTGLGFFSWLGSQIGNLATTIFRNNVKNFLAARLRIVLQDALDKNPF